MTESKMMQFNSKELYSVLGDLLRKLSDLEFIVFSSLLFLSSQKKKLPSSFPAGMDVDKFLLSLHYDE